MSQNVLPMDGNVVSEVRPVGSWAWVVLASREARGQQAGLAATVVRTLDHRASQGCWVVGWRGFSSVPRRGCRTRHV